MLQHNVTFSNLTRLSMLLYVIHICSPPHPYWACRHEAGWRQQQPSSSPCCWRSYSRCCTPPLSGGAAVGRWNTSCSTAPLQSLIPINKMWKMFLLDEIIYNLMYIYVNVNILLNNFYRLLRKKMKANLYCPKPGFYIQHKITKCIKSLLLNRFSKF